MVSFGIGRKARQVSFCSLFPHHVYFLLSHCVQIKPILKLYSKYISRELSTLYNVRKGMYRKTFVGWGSPVP